MIKFVPHHLIDRDKYDRCISQAKNSRIYAFSWYLDCVTEKWDALISDSYKAVMPLPRRKKYGLNYIYTPPWTQQLGIFSPELISEEEVYQFIKKIPVKFILVDYMLNASNPLKRFSHKEKNNFILSLNQSFETLLAGFNKNRRRISKQNFANFHIEKKGSSSVFLELFKRHDKHFTIRNDAFQKMQKLLTLDNEHVHIWNVYKENECVGGLLWLKDAQRITYLVPAIMEEVKKEHVNTFLVNELICEHQQQDLLLDFEGSMIPGVARFYESFGAKTEIYYFYKKRFLTHV
jgi:hypothetical protein